MTSFTNAEGIKIVENLIAVIQENKQYLSDIDGEIGDGDHGINMNKGFTLCAKELESKPGNLSHALNQLSRVLMLKIGGSMGPLYGKFFKGMSKATEEHEVITLEVMTNMISASKANIEEISPAKPGDKTLIDTLTPAVEALNAACESGKSFEEALVAMKEAAIVGRDSTKDMVAKLGRASRLGERSRGVLDAGATSCCLILETIADTSIALINA